METNGTSGGMDEVVSKIVPDTQPIQFENANLSGLKPLWVLISTDFRER